MTVNYFDPHWVLLIFRDFSARLRLFKNFLHIVFIAYNYKNHPFRTFIYCICQLRMYQGLSNNNSDLGVVLLNLNSTYHFTVFDI